MNRFRLCLALFALLVCGISSQAWANHHHFEDWDEGTIETLDAKAKTFELKHADGSRKMNCFWTTETRFWNGADHGEGTLIEEKSLKSGMPVKVLFRKKGDRFWADRILGKQDRNSQ